MPVSWTADLDTGIDVIDKQHRRIVDYINQLEDATKRKDQSVVRQVVDDCVDYTMSHFAFEESLQEEAAYAYAKPHKRVHELFAKRVGEYQARVAQGEDVGAELHDLLGRWLINHIKRDDADYVAAVKASMQAIIREKEKKGGWLKRFFKRGDGQG